MGEDENHFGGMGGLRVRTDNQELVAAEEVDEDDLMNEFDGPPTPREILEAAKIAAASGSPLNLANHDSPRGDISPNAFSDNNHSMQQQQQQQHQQLQAPPAVSVPIFDRSPRPDEDDTTIAEEVVEEEVFGGDHKEESDDEEVNEEEVNEEQMNEIEVNEEEVEEAIMNNSKLTDDLNEFREQLGITPRHTPQYAAGFVEDTADTAVIHSANQGYQYAAAPMTPRRQRQQQQQQQSHQQQSYQQHQQQQPKKRTTSSSKKKRSQSKTPNKFRSPTGSDKRRDNLGSKSTERNKKSNGMEQQQRTNGGSGTRKKKTRALSGVPRPNSQQLKSVRHPKKRPTALVQDEEDSLNEDEEEDDRERQVKQGTNNVEDTEEETLLVASSIRRKKHPKTSRASAGRRRNRNGDLSNSNNNNTNNTNNTNSSNGAKSPELWVSQRRQRMSYDREGLKTAGPSSRPSSKESSTPHQDPSVTSMGVENRNGTAIARSNSTTSNRPSSMAIKSRHKGIDAGTTKGNRSITASPMHIQGNKHQLGVLRGKKMHNRLEPVVGLLLPSASKRQRNLLASATKNRSSSTSSDENGKTNYRQNNLHLSAAAHTAATSIQRWIRKLNPVLGRTHSSTRKKVQSKSPVGSGTGKRRLTSSSTKKRRRGSFSTEHKSQQLPSFMRLLETQPTSPTRDGIANIHEDDTVNNASTQQQQQQPGAVPSRVLKGHTSTISEICVLKESTGTNVAFSSASLDGSVRLWDPQTG